MLGEAAIDLLTLSLCQLHGFGLTRDAVPQVFDELNALGDAQVEEV